MAGFTIKISCGSDVRRITLPKPPSFAELRSIAQQMFGAQLGETMRLKYVDEDGDQVTVSSDLELAEAIASCAPSPGSGRTILRLLAGLADAPPVAAPAALMMDSVALGRVPQDADPMTQSLHIALSQFTDPQRLAAAIASYTERLQQAPLSPAPTAAASPPLSANAPRFGTTPPGSSLLTQAIEQFKPAAPVGESPLPTPLQPQKNPIAFSPLDNNSSVPLGVSPPNQPVTKPFGLYPSSQPASPARQIVDAPKESPAAATSPVVASSPLAVSSPAIEIPQPVDKPAQEPVNDAPAAQQPSSNDSPIASQQPTSSIPLNNNPSKKGNYLARFVADLNVTDLTEMAPGQRFSKIWRLRNDGNTAWPERTQLQWVAGDRLTENQNMDVPLAQAGEEVDVCVDMIAPQRPGRYVSYYRLILPNQERFGHRIWVDILVKVKPAEPVQQPPQQQVPMPQLLQPVVPKPEPVVPKPEPVVPKPEPVVPKPEPVVPKPEPVVPNPEPVAQPQPEPVAQPQPAPVDLNPPSYFSQPPQQSQIDRRFADAVKQLSEMGFDASVALRTLKAHNNDFQAALRTLLGE